MSGTFEAASTVLRDLDVIIVLCTSQPRARGGGLGVPSVLQDGLGGGWGWEGGTEYPVQTYYHAIDGKSDGMAG